MRLSRLSILAVGGVMLLRPGSTSAQVSGSIQFGRQEYFTPEVRVNPYDAGTYGDWRASYRRWSPVTLYLRDGHFYTRTVAGARPVMVYRSGNAYFVPPRDQAWVNYDRRFNYSRRPDDAAYGLIDAALSLFGVRSAPNWPPEVVVRPYDRTLLGDWRGGYRQWQPATLYTRNGRYFQAQVEGARAVTVYRFRGQYFLPPQEAGFRNADRRYNYGRAPTDEDYNYLQRSYGQRGQPNGPPPDQQNRPGVSINIGMYNSQTFGDWRTDYNRWAPVTVYALNGQYYQTNVPGGRAVLVYRSQNNQFFLPPRDQQWMNFDRRYNYTLRPTDDDYTNVQRPGNRRP